MSAPNRRYSTGLRFLDSQLGGGIPVGKLVVLTAPASTQSELLLYHVASANPVRYLSTMTPEESEVRGAIEGSAVGSPVDLEFVYAPAAELFEEPGRFLDGIRPESFVIIDPIDELERLDRGKYVSFVNGLKRRLRETDSIGMFHGLDTDPVPENRRVTLQRADHVWRLEQLILSREIKTRLLVTKARGGRALSDPIPLDISNLVRIDTSRRIA
jgi:hypothetical protein